VLGKNVAITLTFLFVTTSAFAFGEYKVHEKDGTTRVYRIEKESSPGKRYKQSAKQPESEYFRSDIITPEGGNKYKSKSIKWGMPKDKVKRILLKTIRQPVEESPYWLIIRTGNRTRTYAFTDEDELAFVEMIQNCYDCDQLYSIYRKSLIALHGLPSSAHYKELQWEKSKHGIILKLGIVKRAIYTKSYDKRLSRKYHTDK